MTHRIGRFINEDNVVSQIGGDIRGYNLFSYCMNNPVNHSDSSGNWSKTISTLVDIAKKSLEETIRITMLAISKSSKTSHNLNERPYKGEPGSTYKAPNGDTRTYGSDGKPQHDYDHSDHGNPKNHPHDENGGHNHDWVNGKRGKAYVSETNDPVKGFALAAACAIGAFIVAADDITGFGTADDALLGPLGAGFEQGIIMIFG